MRGRGNIAVFGLPTIIALWFFYGFALKYLTPDPDRYGIYWERHEWLYAHVLAGVLALLLGPAQLWLGLNRRTTNFHRTMGILYVLAVAVGGAAAFYLAAHNDFSWVFGLGLGTMGAVWILTTALATIAICLRQPEQHREWMVRSYTVTFGFVTFRVVYELFDVMEFGTMVERMTASSWLAWTLPLVITEAVMQGRKIFSKRPATVKLSEAPYSVLPDAEPVFNLHSSDSSVPQRN
ncbi:MAG TPA: DUF2306 domain-containing protein [Terriglobia bacterium]|nr:DUF2306 domain-containing protein [Terriglobia bacterium]